MRTPGCGFFILAPQPGPKKTAPQRSAASWDVPKSGLLNRVVTLNSKGRPTDDSAGSTSSPRRSHQNRCRHHQNRGHGLCRVQHRDHDRDHHHDRGPMQT
jgi:hypothetical protein